MFSATVMCGNRPYAWNTMFTFRFAGGTNVMSLPCNRIRPTSGISKPAIMRSVVVLPHPEGPNMEKNSPPGDRQRHVVDGSDRAETLGA